MSKSKGAMDSWNEKTIAEQLEVDASDMKKIFFGLWICGFYTSFSGIYAIAAPAVQETFGHLNYSRDYGLLFTQSVSLII